MSVRLLTTPWLTKNFAGVAVVTGGLLRTAVGPPEWYRTASVRRGESARFTVR